MHKDSVTQAPFEMASLGFCGHQKMERLKKKINWSTALIGLYSLQLPGV